MQNIVSGVDLFFLKFTLMIPNKFSAYGTNIDSRMLVKILYVVNLNDMPV